MFAPLLPSLVAPSGSRASLHALRGACQTFEGVAILKKKTSQARALPQEKERQARYLLPAVVPVLMMSPTHREEVGGAATKLMPLPTHKAGIRVRSGQASPLHPLLLPSIPPASPSGRLLIFFP